MGSLWQTARCHPIAVFIHFLTYGNGIPDFLSRHKTTPDIDCFQASDAATVLIMNSFLPIRYFSEILRRQAAGRGSVKVSGLPVVAC